MLNLPIETIIFDLDGTLRHNIPTADDVQYNFVQLLGVEDTPDRQILGTRWAHYYWAQSSDLVVDMERFGDMNDAFWTNYSYRYLKSLEVQDDRASELAPHLYQHMKDTFEPENSVDPCVLETLKAIKAGGYTLGVVSNRSKPCQEECEQLGLLDYFDFAYVAAEVDAWKPDPRIFDRALEISGSPPDRIIYVGDNYYADILGAQNAGIQPVLLDPKGLFPDAGCLTLGSVCDLEEILL